MVSLENLASGVVAGSPRALGRALSLVEAGDPLGRELLRQLPPRPGWMATVGITGPPGAGKSTLIEQVGLRLLSEGERVAVLAVDPTSPFSGGALLGDRLRMPRLAAAGAFLRSVATRGSLGGLSAACSDFLRLLRAAPFSWVLVETIGVGQDEVDVAGVVDTVALVQVPGLGDEVQLVKAGIMEVAHLFVVNKQDRPGAQELVQQLQALVAQAWADAWRPPVLPVTATTGEGVDALVAALRAHQEHLAANSRREALARQRVERQLRQVVGQLVQARLARLGEVWEREVAAVLSGERDSLAAAEELVKFLGGREW